MIIPIVIFFFCFFVIGIVAFFFSWGAKEEISSAGTEYYHQLYRSPGGRFFNNQWPIRTYVLFTKDPPGKVADTVKAMRIIYLALFAFFGLFLACVIFSAVFNGAAS